jgi:hypothetical protein
MADVSRMIDIGKANGGRHDIGMKHIGRAAR